MRHTRFFSIAVVAAALFIGGCQVTQPTVHHSAQQLAAPSAPLREAIAPTGVLRVGLYPGSPTSFVPGKSGQQPVGVAYGMGQALAAQLGVPFKPVIFNKNADVLAAAKRGDVDLVFTNATAERKAFLDFTDTVIHIEKSVLLAPNSAIQQLNKLNHENVRIGVSAGSSTGKELQTIYPRAQLVAMPSLAQARQALERQALDGFATNKSILFEMSDQVPGSKVLPGSWGMESFALGLPQGRGTEAVTYVGRFAALQQANAQLNTWIEQAKLRGAVLPQR